ncbi:MAG: chromosome segregation protein SMC [Bacillota bacterium]|nr:chromosome segregation protein SMC [Bacillota bacterium]
MRLISLTLHGFKSFPERTEIRFNRGLTAIVGPNGSGKSNIADAIRWVLGEQSVRQLRGSRMEDVIFSGTVSRRAMGFAEVVLVLDNSDGELPLDYAEVEVSRRLYRSGDSEYRINRRSCRLRDINSLFMDTGLGRDSYSIIGQGRVDEILSARSDDRRRVFEEAAGIQKYRQRRLDSERRLELTGANLARVSDIMLELERQLGPLAEQAAVAERYLGLRERLRADDVALILLQLEDQDRERASLDFSLESFAADTENLEAEREALERVRLERLKLGSELGERRQEVEGVLGSARDQERELDRLLTTLAERQLQLGQRREDRLAGEADLDRRRSALEAGVKEAEAALLLEQEAAAAAAAAVEAGRGQLAAATEQVDAAGKALATARSEERHLREAIDKELERLVRREGEARVMDRQRALLEARREALAERVTPAEAEALEAAARLDECRAAAAGARAAETEAAAAVEKRLARHQELLSLLEGQERQTAQNAYQLDTLRELERSLTGYAVPVRRLLQHAKQAGLPRSAVLGTLAELIDVSRDYETAIETALGAAAQYIVVDRQETAARLIDWLKREQAGRATFLPLDSMTPRSIEAYEERILEEHRPFGYLGLASDLISYPEKISDIISNQLGRIAVVTDNEAGIRLSRALRQRLRIVTLDGDIFHPGGSMSGGSRQQTGARSGLVGRRRAIRDAERELAAAHRELEKLREDAGAAAGELAAAERELEACRGRREELATELVRHEARRDELERRGQALAAEMAEIAAALETNAADSSRAEHEASGAAERQAELRRALAEAEELIAVAEAHEDELIVARSHIRESLAERDLAALAARNREAEARSSVERARRARRELEQQIEAARRDAQDEEERLAALEAERSAAAARREESQARIQVLEAELQEVGRLLEENRIAEADYHRERSRLAERQADLARQTERLTARRERLAEQRDDALNRLWTDWDLTRDLAAPYRRDDLDREAATRRVRDIRTELRDIGPVNLAALESHANMKKRYEFLSQEKSDIEAATEQLQTVIRELTEAMRRQFEERLAIIRQNFRETFRQLFGGGEADIRLEEGGDSLEAAIEIQVSPPGKRLQNMLLLSGGERSLSAIALLFAIQKLRKAPFCVLDEIEAALDESNVQRFNRYIREYTDQTQYILVTHRRGTMEAADTIYGITMQERGVSRILSMSLGDEEDPA